MTRVHLTFDVDWAPDWCVRALLFRLSRHSAPATFFVTHASPVLDEIRAAGHEIGVHPNFLPGSSHGENPVMVMSHLLEFVPDARVMRAHALVQGSPLLHRIAAAFPQIEFDLSNLTYRATHTEWTSWNFRGERLRRLATTWEDDFAFEDPTWDWSGYHPTAELEVLDLHPIHVALNSADGGPYTRLKAGLGGIPLHHVGVSECDAVREVGTGTATFLDAVLESGIELLTFEELRCASA